MERIAFYATPSVFMTCKMSFTPAPFEVAIRGLSPLTKKYIPSWSDSGARNHVIDLSISEAITYTGLSGRCNVMQSAIGQLIHHLTCTCLTCPYMLLHIMNSDFALCSYIVACHELLDTALHTNKLDVIRWVTSCASLLTQPSALYAHRHEGFARCDSSMLSQDVDG